MLLQVLGDEAERGTVAVLVIWNRRTQVLFAHVAPRKGVGP